MVLSGLAAGVLTVCLEARAGLARLATGYMARHDSR